MCLCSCQFIILLQKCAMNNIFLINSNLQNKAKNGRHGPLEVSAPASRLGARAAAAVRRGGGRGDVRPGGALRRGARRGGAAGVAHTLGGDAQVSYPATREGVIIEKFGLFLNVGQDSLPFL